MTTNISQAMQATIKATELWDAYIYLKGQARQGDASASPHAKAKMEQAWNAMNEADELLKGLLGEDPFYTSDTLRDRLVGDGSGFEPGHLEKLANLRAEAVASIANQAPQLLPLVMANMQMHIVECQAHVRTY